MKLLLICCLFLILSDKRIVSRGGRSGGSSGGGSSGGSSRSTSRSRATSSGSRSYRSSSRSAIYDSDINAYATMSRLASTGNYQRRYGGYYRQPNRYDKTIYGVGEECINNEDFNGTKFGKFYCPLPEFDMKAKYCCGSADEERQYCCTYDETDSSQTGTYIAIALFIGVLICMGLLIYRIIKRRNNLNKFDEQDPSMNLMPSMRPNMIPVNRNIQNGSQAFQMHPPRGNDCFRPANSTAPLSPNSYPMPQSELNSQTTPLINSNANSHLPYPTQPVSSMPQPETFDDKNLPPPSYSEIQKPKD